MKIYEFSYRDIEGDAYSSREFESLKEAKAEITRLIERDECTQVIETWIYEDDNFKGRWGF